MPTKIPMYCPEPGCPALTQGGRCLAHRRAHERRRGTPAQRGYNAQWRRIRRLILARDPICRICCVVPSTEVDHIKPLRQGGTHEPANLQALCGSCHRTKTARQASPREGRGKSLGTVVSGYWRTAKNSCRQHPRPFSGGG